MENDAGVVHRRQQGLPASSEWAEFRTSVASRLASLEKDFFVGEGLFCWSRTFLLEEDFFQEGLFFGQDGPTYIHLTWLGAIDACASKKAKKYQGPRTLMMFASLSPVVRPQKSSKIENPHNPIARNLNAKAIKLEQVCRAKTYLQYDQDFQ